MIKIRGSNQRGGVRLDCTKCLKSLGSRESCWELLCWELCNSKKKHAHIISNMWVVKMIPFGSAGVWLESWGCWRYRCWVEGWILMDAMKYGIKRRYWYWPWMEYRWGDRKWHGIWCVASRRCYRSHHPFHARPLSRPISVWNDERVSLCLCPGKCQSRLHKIEIGTLRPVDFGKARVMILVRSDQFVIQMDVWVSLWRNSLYL